MSDITVAMPDGNVISFPAGTDKDTIQRVAHDYASKNQSRVNSPKPAPTQDFTKNLRTPQRSGPEPGSLADTLSKPIFIDAPRADVDKFKADFFNTFNPDANAPMKAAVALAKNPNDPKINAQIEKMHPVSRQAIREKAAEFRSTSQMQVHPFSPLSTPPTFTDPDTGQIAPSPTIGDATAALIHGPEGANQLATRPGAAAEAERFAIHAGDPESLAFIAAATAIGGMGAIAKVGSTVIKGSHLVEGGFAGLSVQQAVPKIAQGDYGGAAVDLFAGIGLPAALHGAGKVIEPIRAAGKAIPAITDIGDPTLTRGATQRLSAKAEARKAIANEPGQPINDAERDSGKHGAEVGAGTPAKESKSVPQVDDAAVPAASPVRETASNEGRNSDAGSGVKLGKIRPKEGATEAQKQEIAAHNAALDAKRKFSIDPEKQPAPESPHGDSANQTKLANEHVSEERKRYGLDSLPDAIPDSHASAYERALATGEHNKALTTAQEVLDKSRAMTIEEAAGNSMKQHEVKNTVNDLAKKIWAGVDAGTDTTELQAQYDSAREDFRLLTDASKRSGTLQSQAFSFRQEVMDDYSHNNLMQRLEEARPEQPLTPQETEKASRLAAETEKATAEHEATQTDERKSQLAAEEHVEKLQRENRRQVRTETKAKILKDREEIQRRFIQKSTKFHAGIDLSLVKEIGELAASHVKEGVLTVEDLVDKVHEFVSDHLPDVTKREVRDAISGYGYDKPIRPATVLGDLKEQARLMSKIEDVHDPLPPGTPRVVSDAVMKLREEYKQAKEKMSPEEKALVATKQQIENLQKKIKAGDVSGPKRLITVDTEEMRAAKRQLKDTRAKYNALVKAAKVANMVVPPDPFANYKAKLDTKIADIERQIAAGVKDPPKTKARRVYDAEVNQKRAEVERLKKMQDQMVASRKTKTRLQKFARYHRAVILSRVSTLGKLGGAAGERLAFDPLEDVAGKMLEAIPGYGKIARMSPNARGSLRATTKGYSTAFSRDAIAEARAALKTGMNRADVLHGGHDPAFAEAPSVANFPGRVHKAIKTPIQLAAYEKSIVKQEAWAQRRGLDIDDDGVKAAMEARAYLESKRAILMQENTVTNLYSKHVLRALERSGTQAGRNVAAGLRTAMPIVSVPTNFAGEVGLHVGGAGRAAFEVAMAKGIDNLTPEQADIVTRALKKQSVGVALAAIGWYNYKQFGGYYTKGGNKTNDLDPGSVKIGVKIIPTLAIKDRRPSIAWTNEIPHTFLHSPQVEVMTMFADLHQRYDNWKQTKSSETRVGDSALKTAEGFGESIPFLEIFSEFAKAEESPKAGAVKFGATVGSVTIPGLLPDVASMVDKDSRGKTRKRPPQGGMDALKISAGLRTLVPEKR
jgi:hypothetical protein